MYVLDTNTLIYYFKETGNVAQNLFSKPPKDIGIPAISLFELEVGIAKSLAPRKRTQQLREMTSLVNIIPFGDREAKVSAAIRVKLEKQGTPIGPYDLLIGGTALAHQAILVTHNTVEFERIENLRIEDWY
ncbi:MAG TPA: type II toxin-antitoxin system VapC family toxin [Candidatus Lambdaproteobacteria bacterium]|nr:type II toxin-antitoxin system VapC family toxin [SAR324 cluster bacterium]HIB46052.1 type II toxin-antitoxin system VapC family toxin [Candidatus Lambdaproteobacteria bacterium]HIB93437.1 type II toxin-antitoxin system VapC family toxin [Candidatus Lambdaproteobacteria bacterium]HIO11625.1 type II toxin-antitoxin system VapC family toxin [Deltaproteobacteria bacterium]